jgi:hypothetical protein
MARFHVRETFAMNDRSLFVLAGFAIEGEVAAGMLVRLPFNATITVTEEIDHIQRIDRPDGSVACLCLRCHSPEEAALWEALDLKDKDVEVVRVVPNF